MSKVLVTYFGGQPPANPEQVAAMQEAFGQWLASAGTAVIDPGTPLKPGKQLAKGTPAPKVVIGGYTVLECPSLDAALDVLSTHPFVARGGTLQIDEELHL